jgi:chemotaxis signal transduction protein
MQKKHQFCTFRIAGRLFGVNISDVKEINAKTDFTPIWHAPKEVKGYVNIRGRIHLIFDLRLLLGFESCKITDDKSRLVLFKPEVGESFGVLVDSVGDVVEVDETRLEQGLEHDSAFTEENSAPLRESICKLEKELLVVLNARNFLKRIKVRSEK